MKKVIILDVDGTLTNDDKIITTSTKNALLKLQQNGGLIIIATGRPTAGVLHIMNELDMKTYGGYLLCFNGAKILSAKDMSVVYQIEFPKEYISEMYDYAIANDLGLVSYEDRDVITSTRLDSYIEQEARMNHMGLHEVDDFVKYIDFPINKCLFTGEPEHAKQCEEELAKKYDGKLSVYRSAPYFIEAMALGIDKAKSLDELFRIIQINKNDTVACGDGYNDISMIEYAGIGVAMKNAVDEVKNAANVVTLKDNNEDGLVEIISKYFLGEAD